MISPLSALTRRLVPALACLLLPGCSLLDRVVNSPTVIYALAPQQDLPSPLTQSLAPAGQPIAFSPNRYSITKRQRAALQAQAARWQQTTSRVLVLGFSRRGLPSGYARVLSQRRAEAARQVLIEEGIDAARLHTAGYGHDQPSLSTNDEVRLFLVDDSPPKAAQP